MRNALAVLLLALLPACGAGAAVSDDVLADAAARTVDAGSSRIDATVTDAAEGSVAVRGVVDYRASRGRATFELEAPRDDDELEFASEVIFDENAIYVKVVGLGQEFLQGREWVKFDRGQEDSDTFGPFGDDPTKLLEFLKETSDVVHVGSDDVRGTATEHYRGRLDVERAIERLPERDRADARESLDDWDRELRRDGVPLEFWIDEAGLLRRVRLELPDEEKKQERPVATIDFFDFGVEVDVEPPPADQVVEPDAAPSGSADFGTLECAEKPGKGDDACGAATWAEGDACVGPPKDEREAEFCAELKKMCADVREADEAPDFCDEPRRKDDE